MQCMIYRQISRIVYSYFIVFSLLCYSPSHLYIKRRFGERVGTRNATHMLRHSRKLRTTFFAGEKCCRTVQAISGGAEFPCDVTLRSAQGEHLCPCGTLICKISLH